MHVHKPALLFFIYFSRTVNRFYSRFGRARTYGRGLFSRLDADEPPPPGARVEPCRPAHAQDRAYVGRCRGGRW